VIRSGVENVGEWSGQRMEGAALIVQTEQAVMMVGIGTREGRIDGKVSVSSDRRRFIHIERVVADQRDNPRYLGDDEECHQAGAQTADRSYEPHWPRCSARILGETGSSGCGKHATVRNFSQVKDHTHRLRWGSTFNVYAPLPFHAGRPVLALRIIIGMSAFLPLLKPKRTSLQLWPSGFMPCAAPVRLGADVLAERPM
jgi:hypothetical protein